MVARVAPPSRVGMVILLWGWTVLTTIESNTVDAAAADVRVDQHLESHPFNLTGPGRNFVEERDLGYKFIMTLVRVRAEAFEKSSPSVEQFLERAQQNNRVIKAVNSFSKDKFKAINRLFDILNVNKGGTLSLANIYRFSCWDHIVTEAWKGDPLKRDIAMFSVLKKHLDKHDFVSFGGHDLTPAQRIATSAIRRRYDAMFCYQSIHLDKQPSVDLSASSELSRWFYSKVEEERMDAIGLLLSTMKSKGDLDPLATLTASASRKRLRDLFRLRPEHEETRHEVFLSHIVRYKSIVTLAESDRTLESAFEELVGHMSVEEIMLSHELLNWIDTVKLRKLDPIKLML